MRGKILKKYRIVRVRLETDIIKSKKERRTSKECERGDVEQSRHDECPKGERERERGRRALLNGMWGWMWKGGERTREESNTAFGFSLLIKFAVLTGHVHKIISFRRAPSRVRKNTLDIERGSLRVVGDLWEEREMLG